MDLLNATFRGPARSRWARSTHPSVKGCAGSRVARGRVPTTSTELAGIILDETPKWRSCPVRAFGTPGCLRFLPRPQRRRPERHGSDRPPCSRVDRPRGSSLRACGLVKAGASVGAAHQDRFGHQRRCWELRHHPVTNSTGGSRHVECVGTHHGWSTRGCNVPLSDAGAPGRTR